MDDNLLKLANQAGIWTGGLPFVNCVAKPQALAEFARLVLAAAPSPAIAATDDAWDAARYRWLKSEGKAVSVDFYKDHYRCVDVIASMVLTDWCNSFDAAIDAAMGDKS